MRPYLRQNIKQLASSFREGSLNPRLVTDGAFEDVVKYKAMNAFITVTKELAYSQVDDSTLRYQQKSAKSLLDGITIAIKDNFCTKDVKTTCASKMLADFIPPYNATVYERLLNAGCILIGKTNMDEFAMGSATIDSIFGPSKNIWSKSLEDDKWNIAGGSSGGSALAVASGICQASIGSDTGGSTRNPAAHCGVVGLKPTYGLVSRYGLIPLVNSMDVPGIFARNISDCTDVLNHIAGYDFRDVTTYKKTFNPIRLIQPDSLDISKLRVGIPKEYHCSALSPEVVETWQKIADLFENKGAQVQEVSLPHTTHSLCVYSILNQCEVASNMARYDGIEFGHRADENSTREELYKKTRSEGFNDVVKTRILAGNYFLLKGNYNLYFEKALKVRRLIKNDFTNVFEKPSEGEPVDILLTPTTLSAAPAYQSFTDASNRDLCFMQDYCTQSANMAGIPAISIPITLNKDGLPISLQLMSNTLNEELLLNVAQWLEAQVAFNCLNNPQLSHTEQP